MNAALTARGLAVGYEHRRRRHVVLRDADLDLERGALTCLLGPNGSGKSTLLRTLAGMQAPLRGTVHLLGDPVQRLPALERARRCAVVLTDPVDVGLLNGLDLVTLGRHPHTGFRGRLTAADRAAVTWALEATGAEAFAARPVTELSDGERQRVLLARALAQQPAALLLDEPTAFVDVAHRVELLRLTRELARECALAVLVTTHDVDLALRSADTVWLLRPTADGPVHLDVGAPEDLVLSGAIGAAFDAGEVRFDAGRGTFTTRSAGLARVGVTGIQPAAAWLGRAAEREGFTVADDAAVWIEAVSGGWRLRAPGFEAAGATAADLVAELRTLLPRLAELGSHDRVQPQPAGGTE